MKRNVFLIFFVFFVLNLNIQLASAHTLRVDNQIGVILHTNPDDSPLSGVKTTFILYFTDTTSRFNLSNCLCRFVIILGNKTIASEPLTITNSLTSIDHTILPSPGNYVLDISGMPIIRNSFQSFNVSYPITASGYENKPLSTWLIVGIIGLIAIVLTGAYFSTKSGRSKT